MTVNTITGEIVETIGADKASQLTTEAQNEFQSGAAHTARGWELIEQAVMGGGHIDLGYRSPGDYLHAEFEGVLAGFNIAERRLAVRTMTSWGLSTRAIAPVVGASQRTVANDAQVSNFAHLAETPEPAAGGEAVTGSGKTPEGATSSSQPVAGAANEGAPDASPARPAVTGIDGKTYSRPTSTPKPERSGEQQNAEENSRTLASSLIFLLAFQHPTQRDTARTEWAAGSPAVAPTNRGYVTPDRMRQAAEGLLLLADEWEKHS